MLLIRFIDLSHWNQQGVSMCYFDVASRPFKCLDVATRYFDEILLDLLGWGLGTERAPIA